MSKTEKLKQIYGFLKENRKWNEKLQNYEYRRSLTHCESERERLQQHLYSIVNSQSGAKLNSLEKFWKSFSESQLVNGPPMLDDVCNSLTLKPKEKPKEKPEGSWHKLFLALNSQPGWGPKTAALFVKSTINIHRSEMKNLYFLSDGRELCAAEKIQGDCIYLPVDVVILSIFDSCGFENLKTFQAINKELKAPKYSAEQMLIWDDLWFWGYFTQNSQGGNRTLGWNSAKFWCHSGTAIFNEQDIKEIQTQAEKFMGILKSRSI